MSYRTCPICGATAHYRSYTQTLLAFNPIPRQRERFVEITSWQCLSVAAHHGEDQRPTDTAPGSSPKATKA